MVDFEKSMDEINQFLWGLKVIEGKRKRPPGVVVELQCKKLNRILSRRLPYHIDKVKEESAAMAAVIEDALKRTITLLGKKPETRSLKNYKFLFESKLRDLK